MKNNSLAKKGQNGPINPRTWDIQTITGRVLTKECESEKRISRPFGNIPFCTVSTMYYFDKWSPKKGKIVGDNNWG